LRIAAELERLAKVAALEKERIEAERAEVEK
jgi:hypothetical protein